jgi:hypothetical protein
MRKGTFAMAVMFAALVITPTASAFEGGGRKPSEAPLITVGQHYSATLNNHNDDSNYAGFRSVAIWHLPTVTSRDVITVDWDAAPYTGEPGRFPICMTIAQGVNDFNWGERFEEVLDHYRCIDLSGSGSARTEIVVQEANSNSTYLEFSSYANETQPARYETYPYNFTVEPILHYLAVAIRPVKRVNAAGIIRATANLASGLPAPDGLPFNLAVTWPDGGVANYSAVSSGGIVGFQLALPETAFGKTATFEVSHSADGTYQGVTATKLQAKVAKPKAPPPSPCFLAERRVLALKRQYHRLRRHAARAYGVNRRVLRRRARRAKHQLREARLTAESLCGGG